MEEDSYEFAWTPILTYTLTDLTWSSQLAGHNTFGVDYG